METTDKESCRILVSVLEAHGVRRAVVSPGSRNAPLLVALARNERIEKRVIVDERSAAFVALGLAQQTQEPVVLVCTSGTALLNYAPAVAEAYYQKLPLIVVSADRPKEWIDQDDSQTIRQFEALSQFVKKSYDLPARCGDETSRWYVNRIANDAMMEALSGRRAPVHLNVQLDEPLNRLADADECVRTIRLIEPSAVLPESEVRRLAEEARGKNVLVVVGFHAPDAVLLHALERLAALPNVAVLTETVANLPSSRFIRAIDRTLLAMPEGNETGYAPDLLITLGGAIISRNVKAFLRKNRAEVHWHVGVTDTTIDCMKTLTARVETDPGVFFRQFAELCDRGETAVSGYSGKWHALAEAGLRRHAACVGEAGWCDLKALSVIFPSVPASFRLQLSNGTVIRYAQLFGDSISVRNHCNRGVSGIDGSTSTALGASLAYSEGTTLLVTGDMSFSYDLSGLASQYASARFKIIVMCNGGGGIFRFIKSTSSLPELERYFEVGREIPVEKYAAAFGFGYLEARNEEELRRVLPDFYAADAPAILAVKTGSRESADALRCYFEGK